MDEGRASKNEAESEAESAGKETDLQAVVADHAEDERDDQEGRAEQELGGDRHATGGRRAAVLHLFLNGAGGTDFYAAKLRA